MVQNGHVNVYGVVKVMSLTHTHLLSSWIGIDMWGGEGIQNFDASKEKNTGKICQR